MELTELLNTAARGWERVTPDFDPRLEDHYVVEDGEIKINAGCYRRTTVGSVCEDQLSHVAVVDIVENYDPEASDAEQVHEAVRAVGQLSTWLDGITSELISTGDRQGHCPTCACG